MAACGSLLSSRFFVFTTFVCLVCRVSMYKSVIGFYSIERNNTAQFPSWILAIYTVPCWVSAAQKDNFSQTICWIWYSIIISYRRWIEKLEIYPPLAGECRCVWGTPESVIVYSGGEVSVSTYIHTYSVHTVETCAQDSSLNHDMFVFAKGHLSVLFPHLLP